MGTETTARNTYTKQVDENRLESLIQRTARINIRKGKVVVTFRLWTNERKLAHYVDHSELRWVRCLRLGTISVTSQGDNIAASNAALEA